MGNSGNGVLSYDAYVGSKPQLEVRTSSLELDFVPDELSDVCEVRMTRHIQVTD